LMSYIKENFKVFFPSKNLHKDIRGIFTCALLKRSRSKLDLWMRRIFRSFLFRAFVSGSILLLWTGFKPHYKRDQERIFLFL
jgi:hypothetical protein